VPEEPLAFIFPAFVTEYPVDPFSDPTGTHQYFRSFLQRAAQAVDPELLNFDHVSPNFLDDELRTQFMTYLLCCSYADFLKDKKIVPSICAGYSMGIYAAAYAAGSNSFEDGLFLIRQAFWEISRITAGKNYGMGTILGLGMEDISRLVTDASGTLEIANQNSPYSFILSGNTEEIKTALDKAQDEGALNVRMLNVTIPYHSKILKGTEIPFSAYIECLAVKGPEIPVISLIDQSLMTDSAGLKKEISRNLFTRLNYYQTQLQLQNSGIRSFIECGPGKTLVKNAKFVGGGIPFYSASSLIDS
jgi:[acyl-carrier-protein] S-malonyltransferase